MQRAWDEALEPPLPPLSSPETGTVGLLSVIGKVWSRWPPISWRLMIVALAEFLSSIFDCSQEARMSARYRYNSLLGLMQADPF